MMRRRQLLLQSSDDEESSGENPSPPSDAPALSFEVLNEDDFVDAPDFLSPPPSPLVSSHQWPPPAMEPTSASGGVGGFLRKMGLGLRTEWLDACLAALSGSVAGFESLDVAAKSKICFEEFLSSDMNFSGDGVLPQGVHLMHMAELEGPFVLQVDEIVNISSSIRERYHETPAGPKRCLKLSVSDGNQHVFGIEYRPIKALEVLGPAGSKIVVRNVPVRRGLLMLVPEVMEVLGGVSEELDAARKRLVKEVNKSPRGRKQGSLPLTERASLAAWQPNMVKIDVSSYSSTAPGVKSAQATAQVPFCNVETVIGGNNFAEPFQPPIRKNNAEELNMSQTSSSAIEDSADPKTDISADEDSTDPQTDSSAIEDSTDPQTASSAIENLQTAVIGLDIQDVPVEIGSNTDHNVQVNIAPDVLDTCVVKEAMNLYNVNGDQEVPFTYMACLSLKHAIRKDKMAVVQGKVKCFLTDVKEFQYKERRTFELRVYVDDGSLISEILVDHSVVQNSIGHSPEEVSFALSSSDRNVVANMEDTMKIFHHFLSKFEGTMLIQISETSSLPVALDMNQGCSSSDAWLIVRRLNMSTSTSLQDSHPQNSSPASLSP